MEIALGFFLALFLSLLLVPVFIKLAPRLRLVDVPDARKSHVGLIPRVGGIGIAIAAILPTLLWVAHETRFVGFVIGGALIVLFGVLDDRHNLDFRIKLLGQTAAAVIVVASGICLYHLPLFGLDAAPDAIAFPITVVFVLTVTNAFNLLDGLDGLAAGCAILSLGSVALLAFPASEGGAVVFISLATIGGVLGFLRYNTHPASVFMGDAGSQFLGFSIAALSIMLVEHTQSALSPAVILPLLGLPILDTVMVVVLRVRQGRSPFSPDRNHIHHKLLSVGLNHHQAVAAIYAVQALIVATALILRFESDYLILLVYVSICFGCIGCFLIFRRYANPRSADHSDFQELHGASGSSVRWKEKVRSAALRYTEWSAAGYIIVGAIAADATPIDVSILAIGLAGLVVFSIIAWKRKGALVVRLSAYLTVIYVSYVTTVDSQLTLLSSTETSLWIASVVVAMATVIAFTPRDQFELSTLDLLIVLVVVGTLWIPIPTLDHHMISQVLIRSVVFLYAWEVLLGAKQISLGSIGLAVTLSLLILGRHAFYG